MSADPVSDTSARRRSRRAPAEPLTQRECQNPECRVLFSPKQATQRVCSESCRKAVWRLANPTYADILEMTDEALAAVLQRILQARGKDAVVETSGTKHEALAGHLARLDDGALRRVLHRAMELRYPGGRGRLRVRFGDSRSTRVVNLG